MPVVNLSMAWCQLRTNKAFTLMTSLSMALATAIVTSTLSLAGLGLDTAKSAFNDMGFDVIQLSFSPVNGGESLTLQRDDIDRLQAVVPHSLGAVGFFLGSVVRRDGYLDAAAQLISGDADALRWFVPQPLSGRLPSAAEFSEAICLLDSDHVAAGVHRGVLLEGRSVRAIGTFPVRGPITQAVTRSKPVVFAPTALATRLDNRGLTQHVQIRLAAGTYEHVQLARRLVEQFVAVRYPKLSVVVASPWDVLGTTRALVESVTQMTLLIGLVIAGLSCLATSNSMLMSIAHRRVEIATLLAIGAKPSDIACQLMFEALFIILVGLAMGWSVSLVSTYFWCAWSHWPWHVVPSALAVTAALGGLGILGSGLWPAVRAARLDPVEALRS